MSTDPTKLPCPWCGRVNDKHFAVGEPDALPGDLDVSLCMSCGRFSLFCVHDDDGEIHMKKPPGAVGYAHIVNVLQGAAG